MSPTQVACGFCDKKFLIDPADLPFACPNCRCLVDLPARENEADVETMLQAFSRGKEIGEAATAFEIPSGQRERYLVEKKLAAGGMGEILLVRDTLLDRRVAMKVLRKQMALRAMGRRFAAEAKITARLEHPNIVPIYDMGRDRQDSMYFTMKHIKGRSLSEFVASLRAAKADSRESSLPMRLQIFQKICQAVAYAHFEGVLHRDLKPANVMLGEFGEVLLLDWGIAKSRRMPQEKPRAEGRTELAEIDSTQFGQIVGTPGYMSPEQAGGDLAKIDERSDVYGLGAILYELVYLKAAFTGPNTQAILLQASLEDPKFDGANEIGQKIHPKLRVIVRKAMARDRRERYASPKELEEDIDRFLEGKPVRAKKETFAEKLSRVGRINMATALDVGDVAVLLVAALIFGAAAIGAGKSIQQDRHYRDYMAEAARCLVRVELGEYAEGVPDPQQRQKERERLMDHALWCAEQASALRPGRAELEGVFEKIRRFGSLEKGE